jgi:DNA polymerase V
VPADLRRCRAAVLSSNSALYADMSSRVMGLLAQSGRRQDIYSIECFLDVSGEPDPLALAARMRAHGRGGLGLPVCVGGAPPKTLAKKGPASSRVFSFMELDEAGRLALLNTLPVEQIQVSRRLGLRLRLEKMSRAGALAHANHNWLQRRFGIVLARLSDELSGVSCLELETVQAPKKSLISSRSFERKVTIRAELKEAVSMHAAKLGVKLRREGALAAFLQVPLRSGLYAPFSAYRDSEVIVLVPLTNDSRRLIAAARAGIQHLYRAELRYHKAGAGVFELSPVAQAQDDLFAGSARNETSVKRMQTLDTICRKLGAGTLRWAAEGCKQPVWAVRRNHLSPKTPPAGTSSRWSRQNNGTRLRIHAV